MASYSCLAVSDDVISALFGAWVGRAVVATANRSGLSVRGRGQDRLIELLPEGDRPLPNLRFARDGHRPAAFAFCHHGRHDGGSLKEGQGVMRAELSGADPIRG